MSQDNRHKFAERKGPADEYEQKELGKGHVRCQGKKEDSGHTRGSDQAGGDLHGDLVAMQSSRTTSALVAHPTPKEGKVAYFAFVN